MNYGWFYRICLSGMVIVVALCLLPIMLVAKLLEGLLLTLKIMWTFIQQVWTKRPE